MVSLLRRGLSIAVNVFAHTSRLKGSGKGKVGQIKKPAKAQIGGTFDEF